jgi:pimeloyl-ACP methyl ester carboxylesterase
VSTFCLVHGAWHGAWCWERLTPELEALGHRSIAVDLPCDDTSVDSSGYARVVVDALGNEDDVVLVGHSMGGLTIPLVAAARPVRHLVFLCALLPVPGMAFSDQFQADPEILRPELTENVERDPDRGVSWWPDADKAIASMYQDCSPADASWAVKRLRLQAVTPQTEPCQLHALPDVERTYVVARDDRAVDPGWSRRAAPKGLGVTPVEIDGGHSPFLARPSELAGVLASLA